LREHAEAIVNDPSATEEARAGARTLLAFDAEHAEARRNGLTRVGGDLKDGWRRLPAETLPDD